MREQQRGAKARQRTGHPHRTGARSPSNRCRPRPVISNGEARRSPSACRAPTPCCIAMIHDAGMPSISSDRSHWSTGRRVRHSDAARCQPKRQQHQREVHDVAHPDHLVAASSASAGRRRCTSTAAHKSDEGQPSAACCGGRGAHRDPLQSRDQARFEFVVAQRIESARCWPRPRPGAAGNGSRPPSRRRTAPEPGPPGRARFSRKPASAPTFG